MIRGVLNAVTSLTTEQVKKANVAQITDWQKGYVLTGRKDTYWLAERTRTGWQKGYVLIGRKGMY